MDISEEERARRTEIVRHLKAMYPGDAVDLCELKFSSAFELAVATVLSAQCTDVTVNSVTPALFARFSTPALLAQASLEEVEKLIYSTGFYRNKAKNLISLAQGLVTGFAGEMPSGMEDLVTLAGIGRKTANVIRSVAFGLPGLAVDTHVIRLSGRLGLTQSSDPVKIERDYETWLDERELGGMSLRLILHGRRICNARKPLCDRCELAQLCPSAFTAR